MAADISSGRLWAGTVITVLVVAFLLFDGITKVMRVAPVMEASKVLGLPAASVAGIGLLLLACTTLYAIPTTAVLGAVLLTGYLGGATAIHVRAGSAMFPVVFSVGFGVLAWAGLILREPRLLRMILLRQ